MARPQIGDLLLGSAHANLLNRAAYINELGYAVKAETTFSNNTAKGLLRLMEQFSSMTRKQALFVALLKANLSQSIKQPLIQFWALNY